MERRSHHPPLLRALAWTAGMLTGLTAFVLLRARPGGRALPARGRVGNVSHLHHAILGRPMRSILETLGPPRASTAPRRAGAEGDAYLDADTWYYPHDPVRRTALAIGFIGGVARTIEVVHAPR